MKCVKSIFLIGIICVGVLSTIVVYAQDITFEATVDKTRMSYEDVLVLSFVLSGGGLDMNVSPELPDLQDNFDILGGPSRSTSISIINGRQSSSLTIQYVLSPKKTGMLEIDSATLQHKKKTFTTKAITVEVLKSAPSPSQGAPQTQDSSESGVQPEVFIRAEVDKEIAYIGEQITVSYMLYTRVNISGYDIQQQPNFTGFWVEELQIPQPPKLQYRTINGQQYGVALMKKVALFPTSSGEATIDPLVMTFGVRTQTGRSRDPFGTFFADPFGRTQEIIRKTQALELKILPLPEENRPEIFNGDVGRFTMSVEADPIEVTQDEPITLRAKIQGAGNIKTVKEPIITLPDSFKRYDTQISETPFTLQEPIQGKKVFETVIIPSSEGTFQIPPIQFVYFDPQRKTYQTLRSQPIDLVILPKTDLEEPMERRIATKEEIKLLGQDIRFIKTDIHGLKNHGSYWYQHGLFQISLALPILIIVATWGYKSYRGKYMSDERHLRWKRANKLSKQRLKSAYELMNQGKSKKFYAVISSTLRQYIGDKLDIPPASITGQEISLSLQERGLDEDTAQLLKQCLDRCDFARFAPVEDDKDEMTAMLRDVETILEQIGRIKEFGSKNSVVLKQMIILCVIPLLSLSLSFPVQGATPSVEELFRQGNTLYEQENYQGAIESYQQILATGLENGYVYYNLGNALLKEQRIGEAILQYERAQRLLPRDEDIVFNLDYARALTLDKMESDDGGFARMLSAIRNYFTPNEVSLFLGLVYLILTAILITFIFVPRRWKLRLIYLALPPAVLLLGSAILLYVQMTFNSVDDAILLAPKIEAKTGPGEGYSTVFEIHEGAKVRIQREKLDWVEIKLPNKVIGWIPKNDLARI